ncbi:hypothetical protein ACMFMG_006823 [Clarireedia jacksonii]
MARYKMDVLIFVVNNSGIYQVDSASADAWRQLQQNGLRSTSLSWEVRYEMLTEMCGGRGYFVRTPKELERATREGFLTTREGPTVVNVVIEAGEAKALEFAWQQHLKTKDSSSNPNTNLKREAAKL